MPQRFKYQVILYSLQNGDSKAVVIAESFDNIGGARAAMNRIASKHWHLNRRPDVHTIGDLVMCIRVKGAGQ